MKHTAFLSHSFSVCFDFITMVRVTWNKEEAAACICEGLPSKQKPGGEIGGWIEQLRQIDFSLEIRWIFLTRTPTFLRDWEADESQVKVCEKCVKKGEIEQKQNKTKRFSKLSMILPCKKKERSLQFTAYLYLEVAFSPQANDFPAHDLSGKHTFDFFRDAHTSQVVSQFLAKRVRGTLITFIPNFAELFCQFWRDVSLR